VPTSVDYAVDLPFQDLQADNKTQVTAQTEYEPTRSTRRSSAIQSRHAVQDQAQDQALSGTKNPPRRVPGGHVGRPMSFVVPVSQHDETS